MSDLSLEQKFELFHEYFLVKRRYTLNILPITDPDDIPGESDFENEIPELFQIASEVSAIDAKMLRPLMNLGDVADDLVEFLRAQSRKIDLLMSHILVHQDHEGDRCDTQSFGGGGLTFFHEKKLEVGTMIRLKLFLKDEASAIYGYGEILQAEEEDERFHHSLLFTRLREEDREIIVRASLHEQSKQLKRKAQARQKDKGTNS
ncbi:PilZ domain-containing protein [Algicola sagamiensis]|uniref:PilZ domain-containing protein n=1 Tax=Algicola sagamiensis TaxID=163869 RepID=UPI000371CB44|nr:PilZ domain-containing protein [Algicola sagamiensis]